MVLACHVLPSPTQTNDKCQKVVVRCCIMIDQLNCQANLASLVVCLTSRPEFLIHIGWTILVQRASTPTEMTTNTQWKKELADFTRIADDTSAIAQHNVCIDNLCC